MWTESDPLCLYGGLKSTAALTSSDCIAFIAIMQFYLLLQEEDDHLGIRQYLKSTSRRRRPQCISGVQDWL